MQPNSGYGGSTNIGSLGTFQGSNATSFDTGSTAYNGVTLDFNTAGNHSVYAFPFLGSASSANVKCLHIVIMEQVGQQLLKGQTPYTFTGRSAEWGRTGSGHGERSILDLPQVLKMLTLLLIRPAIKHLIPETM